MRHALILLAACGASHVAPRFVDAPPVTRVNDRLDVPKPPREVKMLRATYNYDSYYLRAERGWNLTRDRRALGINALDEVPDSTWFTNRVGVRDVSLDELRASPRGESPEAYKPWTIDRGKSQGMAIGFMAHDTRGVKFILKFDEKHAPEVETGGDVVVGKLLWAAGWNVPSDHVVHLKRDELVIAPDAKAGKVKIDRAWVDAQLAKVAVEPDGRIRAVASLLLPGKPVGGAPRLGTREDDPNDTIPHELRRDLRGLRALCAWLGHVDLKEDNTLDTWQEDPANPKVHYVVHYQLDFGKALGGMAFVNRRWVDDYGYQLDLEQETASLLSLGLWRQPWEGRTIPHLRGIGMFSADHYHPAEWKPDSMSQFPVIFADRIDQFWGSKILIRFTREQIAAAVESGKYSDPKAAAYLVDTLVARQRITARHWFREVNPLDEFTYDHGKLCFTDLALRHRLETAATTFGATLHDARGKRFATVTGAADAAGHACLEVPARNYEIVRITSSRRLPPTDVHVGAYGVIGVYRH